MRKDTLPPCAADALRQVRQMTINGHPVGIMKPTSCIATVRAQELPGDEEIMDALLKAVKTCNGIPPPVEAQYTRVLSKNTGKLHGRSPGSALCHDPLIPGEPEFRHAPAFLRGIPAPLRESRLPARGHLPISGFSGHNFGDQVDQFLYQP